MSGQLPRRLAAFVAAFVFGVGVDPGRVGLAMDGSVDVAGWAYLSVLAAPGLLLLTLAPHRLAPMLRVPALPLTIGALWTVLVAPFGRAGVADVVMAVAVSAIGVFGVWLGTNWGWDRLVPPLALGLAASLLASVVAQDLLGGEERWQGVTVHPNVLGGIGVCAVVLAAALLFHSPRHGLALGVLAFGLIVAADSRTSLIAAVAGLVVFSAPYLGRAIPALAVVAALGLATVVVVTDSVEELGADISRSGDVQEVTSLTGRTAVWEVTIEAIRQDPWLGVGSDSAEEPFEKANAEGRLDWPAASAHNQALQAGLNGGLPALVAFVAFLPAYFVVTRRRPSAGRDAMVTAVLIIGLTEPLSREPTVGWFLLAAAAGAAIPACQIGSSSSTSSSSQTRRSNSSASAS